MSSSQAYIEKYAEYSMEQMRRYGIPASVTLAQGICESANGKSELSRLGNNHFGIKAGKSWLENGGDYLVYDDDKPNEKFCKYASVADSFEHHSRVLANSKRYAECFKLSPDDYVGWTNGLQKGGYATKGTYAKDLQNIIKSLNLQKYDQQVMAEMKKEGKNFGIEENPRHTTSESKHSEPKNVGKEASCHYSFPVNRAEFMLITSGFGNRQDPINKSGTQFHKGIDIKTKHDNVLATEDNGKVIATNSNVKTAGGKSVTVEYDRRDGTKYQCTYMHLDSIVVKQGDVVNAGQKLGVSGNTGTRTTGEHLHFGVKSISPDGSKRDMDPAAYLADVAVKGNIKVEALYNGKDLLAKFKDNNVAPDEKVNDSDKQLTPENWMKKLLGSEDSRIDSGHDPIIEYAMTLFASLMAVAVQIDQRDTESKNNTITESLVSKTIDLSSLLPKLQKPELSISDTGNMQLSYGLGGKGYAHQLTQSEQTKLMQILSDENISTEQKTQNLSMVVNGIIGARQVSDTYQQMSSELQSQETILRQR